MFSSERLPYATHECNLHPRVVRVAPSRHQCTNSIPSDSEIDVSNVPKTLCHERWRLLEKDFHAMLSRC